MSLKHLILLLCTATLVLACGREEGTVEIEETVEIEAGESSFEAEAEAEDAGIPEEEPAIPAISDRFGESGKIPDGFPEDVPVYPDSEVTDATVAGGAVLIKLRTGDDFEKVVAFYREKFAEEGWSLVPEREYSGGRVLPVEKEGRKGAAQISRETDGTAIFIALGAGAGG